MKVLTEALFGDLRNVVGVCIMVAVGGVPDDLKGEIAVAYVVLKPGACPDEAGILDLCRRELAAYKVPRAVRFVTDLPKTSTGKIDKKPLRESLAAERS